MENKQFMFDNIVVLVFGAFLLLFGLFSALWFINTFDLGPVKEYTASEMVDMGLAEEDENSRLWSSQISDMLCLRDLTYEQDGYAVEVTGIGRASNGIWVCLSVKNTSNTHSLITMENSEVIVNGKNVSCFLSPNVVGDSLLVPSESSKDYLLMIDKSCDLKLNDIENLEFDLVFVDQFHYCDPTVYPEDIVARVDGCRVEISSEGVVLI